MADITGATASLYISVPPLFAVPQKIEGFAADDIYDIDEIESVETTMGVDGILSGGFTWKPQPQSIMLQADSPSCAFFDAWFSSQLAARTTYVATGVISLPAIGLKMIQTRGFLRGYKLPGAKKLLTPRRFRIEWNQVVPAPI